MNGGMAHGKDDKSNVQMLITSIHLHKMACSGLRELRCLLKYKGLSSFLLANQSLNVKSRSYSSTQQILLSFQNASHFSQPGQAILWKSIDYEKQE